MKEKCSSTLLGGLLKMYSGSFFLSAFLAHVPSDRWWSSVIRNYGIAASLCLCIWPLQPMASTLTPTESPHSYQCSTKKKSSRSNDLHTHTRGTFVWLCFIMTSLCIVHPTNTQSLIFPLNTSLSRWLHPVLGRKGHTIKWLRPSVHVIEWWCITPGWLYVYLTHCEHEYDFRDH